MLFRSSSPVPELEFEIVELRPMAAQQDNSPAPEPDQIKQMAAAQIQRAAVPALIRSEKNTLSDESLAAPSQEESPAQDAIPPAAAITQHTPINPHPGIPPEQVTAAQPIPVAGISTPPRSNAGHLNNPEPTYPLSARKRRLEGIVLLMVDVSNDGHPAAVSVKESSGHIVLDDAARTAVERWRFIPATQDGRNISAQVTIPIRFKLN